MAAAATAITEISISDIWVTGLGSEDRAVRRETLEEFVALLEEDDNSESTILDAFCTIEIRDVLIKCLVNDNLILRRHALKAIIKLVSNASSELFYTEQVRNALIKNASHADVVIRQKTLAVLFELITISAHNDFFATKEMIAVLIQNLSHVDPFVRQNALQVLAEFIDVIASDSECYKQFAFDEVRDLLVKSLDDIKMRENAIKVITALINIDADDSSSIKSRYNTDEVMVKLIGCLCYLDFRLIRDLSEIIQDKISSSNDETRAAFFDQLLDVFLSESNSLLVASKAVAIIFSRLFSGLPEASYRAFDAKRKENMASCLIVEFSRIKTLSAALPLITILKFFFEREILGEGDAVEAGLFLGSKICEAFSNIFKLFVPILDETKAISAPGRVGVASVFTTAPEFIAAPETIAPAFAITPVSEIEGTRVLDEVPKIYEHTIIIINEFLKKNPEAKSILSTKEDLGGLLALCLSEGDLAMRKTALQIIFILLANTNNPLFATKEMCGAVIENLSYANVAVCKEAFDLTIKLIISTKKACFATESVRNALLENLLRVDLSSRQKRLQAIGELVHGAKSIRIFSTVQMWDALLENLSEDDLVCCQAASKIIAKLLSRIDIVKEVCAIEEISKALQSALAKAADATLQENIVSALLYIPKSLECAPENYVIFEAPDVRAMLIKALSHSELLIRQNAMHIIFALVRSNKENYQFFATTEVRDILVEQLTYRDLTASECTFRQESLLFIAGSITHDKGSKKIFSESTVFSVVEKECRYSATELVHDAANKAYFALFGR